MSGVGARTAHSCASNSGEQGDLHGPLNCKAIALAQAKNFGDTMLLAGFWGR